VHLCTCFPVSESKLALAPLPGGSGGALEEQSVPSEDVLRATPSLADSAQSATLLGASIGRARPPHREFRRGVGRNPSSRTSWDSPVVVVDVALEATYRQCKGHHVRQGSDGHYVKNTRHRVRNTCSWQSLYLVHSCDALRRRDTRRTSYATAHCRGGGELHSCWDIR
jgi:hypothetical protein